MFRWGRASVAYGLIAALALALGSSLGHGSLLLHPAPWFDFADAQAHVFSLVLGALFAGCVIVSTRVAVQHTRWARELHRDLRPVTLELDRTGIAIIAGLSALGEELVFRGLLTPWLGVVPQALIFGAVHAQLSGPSRWVWVSWATLVGLALGSLFGLTGSLMGPILAHATINGFNLAYLKSHDTAPTRRTLGGLLSTRRPLTAGRRA